jgi:hypothetical protein
MTTRRVLFVLFFFFATMVQGKEVIKNVNVTLVPGNTEIKADIELGLYAREFSKSTYLQYKYGLSKTRPPL